MERLVNTEEFQLPSVVLSDDDRGLFLATAQVSLKRGMPKRVRSFLIFNRLPELNPWP